MTPHIEAKKEDIASIVIMPGDPLRAKYIAEEYLSDCVLVNTVRNMLAYTGYYKNKRITVMGHGMGIPSVGIYSFELYKFYDVDIIIRIGSCGAYKQELNLFDTILVDSAYTESNFALSFNSQECHLIDSSFDVTNKIYECSKRMDMKIHRGTILTSDGFDFYIDIENLLNRIPKEIEVIGAEMEAFGLFYTAKNLNKKAACLATVVDKYKEQVQVTREAREKALNNMIKLALESTLYL